MTLLNDDQLPPIPPAFERNGYKYHWERSPDDPTAFIQVCDNPRYLIDYPTWEELESRNRRGGC